jgi:hypothetical protein
LLIRILHKVLAIHSFLESTQAPIQWVSAALSVGVKRPGREVDHSPTSNAEVKNVWSYISTPQYAFLGWCSGLFGRFNIFDCVYKLHHVCLYVLLSRTTQNYTSSAASKFLL